MELFDQEVSMFPVSYTEIMERVKNINPHKYGATRNYLNGAVTYLSPYISRGVISTKRILYETLERGYDPNKIEKFIQELAWRDYWQQIWISKGSDINSDLKHQQVPVSNHGISNALLEAHTTIDAIDEGIAAFYQTGYLHNHLRMYIASLACNIAESHWRLPAQWMYYHLLDADWASNALSWQWVAGANSNKKYIANQDNINKYCFSAQKNTFLDTSYARLENLEVPKALLETTKATFETTLPTCPPLLIDPELPTYIYNFYNIDPIWDKNTVANRVLLLEPSHFKNYPITTKTIEFMIALAQKNIPEIKVYVGEFNELAPRLDAKRTFYKEHPLNHHFKGIEEPREWLCEVTGYHSSFFSFWKKCKKQLDF